MRHDCFACRVYFDDCEETRHSKRIWAKHKDGTFWWGRKANRAKGLWVKICVWCRDALQNS